MSQSPNQTIFPLHHINVVKGENPVHTCHITLIVTVHLKCALPPTLAPPQSKDVTTCFRGTMTSPWHQMDACLHSLAVAGRRFPRCVVGGVGMKQSVSKPLRFNTFHLHYLNLETIIVTFNCIFYDESMPRDKVEPVIVLRIQLPFFGWLDN